MNDDYMRFSNLNYSTSSSVEPTSLSMETISKAVEFITPTLYYATWKYVERGTLYYIKKSEYNPEYILLNPEDLTEARRKLFGRRLVHIRNMNRNGYLKPMNVEEIK